MYYSDTGEQYVDGDPEYVGSGNSLDFDLFGNPHITYFDSTNGFLKHAWWNGETWEKEVIDENARGRETSLEILETGKMMVSYVNTHETSISTKNLRYATFDGEHWDVETIYSSIEMSPSSSLAVDAYGRIWIAFIADGKVWILKK